MKSLCCGLNSGQSTFNGGNNSPFAGKRIMDGTFCIETGEPDRDGNYADSVAIRKCLLSSRPRGDDALTPRLMLPVGPISRCLNWREKERFSPMVPWLPRGPYWSGQCFRITLIFGAKELGITTLLPPISEIIQVFGWMMFDSTMYFFLIRSFKNSWRWARRCWTTMDQGHQSFDATAATGMAFTYQITAA